jgi:hypothetical protein
MSEVRRDELQRYGLAYLAHGNDVCTARLVGLGYGLRAQKATLLMPSSVNFLKPEAYGVLHLSRIPMELDGSLGTEVGGNQRTVRFQDCHSTRPVILLGMSTIALTASSCSSLPSAPSKRRSLGIGLPQREGTHQGQGGKATYWCYARQSHLGRI